METQRRNLLARASQSIAGLAHTLVRVCQAELPARRGSLVSTTLFHGYHRHSRGATLGPKSLVCRIPSRVKVLPGELSAACVLN